VQIIYRIVSYRIVYADAAVSGDLQSSTDIFSQQRTAPSEQHRPSRRTRLRDDLASRSVYSLQCTSLDVLQTNGKSELMLLRRATASA